jgi:2-oxoisovalerate dehydrogenase E1 component
MLESIIARDGRESEAAKVPGFRCDARGKPIIPASPRDLYAYGDLIRRTERLILAQFGRGLVSGTTHTCLGQELCQMAVVRALDHGDDAVLSNHRNHGHFLTYSGEFVGLVAEIMGRQAGVCGGGGGSQHLAYRHFHSNGVQGGMAGIGAGLALARKLRNSEAIVAIMIGDGTLGEGLFYEGLNLASTWGVPALFVVEHNGIAQTTRTADTIGGDIETRGRAFGLRSWRADDADPDVCRLAEEVVAQVRRSGRPGLLVIETRRLGPHSKGDDLRGDEELAAIRERDPLAALGRRLAVAVRQEIEARNAAFIDEVEAVASASPEARFAESPRHIFDLTAAADFDEPRPTPGGGNVRAALNGALRHLLDRHGETLLLGEDLHDPYGGAFRVTAGLSTDFPGRVLSTPISEAGVTGAGIGLALAGFRPVVEVMFADFLTLCLDQLYNHAVKFPGVFPGMRVPLVVRSPGGGRRGYGPTHSQSPENLLTSVPGLTVIAGSHRHDNGRLLADASRRWPYPVLFLEHKLLYSEAQDAGDYRELPADPGDPAAALFPTLVRPAADPDVTILAYGGMLPVVERAARRLEEEELSVEIVAPSLLAPFPKGTIIDRLQDRERVVVAEESHHEFGVGAEVLACLLEAGFRGRALRVGTPPVPLPSARSLESRVIPDEGRLAEDILRLF